MSQDSRLCYMLHPYYHQWAAWRGSGSEDYFEPPGYATLFNSEEEMLAWVDQQEQEGWFECGTTEIGADEQRVALTYAIEDLTARLARLNETGSQRIRPIE